MAGKGWVVKAVAAAVVSLGVGAAALMTGCSGGEEEGGIEGDWIFSYERVDGEPYYSADDDSTYRVGYSIKPSHELIVITFRKLGSFWAENPDTGAWVTNGSTISMAKPGNEDEPPYTYKVSGKKLILTPPCEYDKNENKYRCHEATLTKVNLADYKKGLGTVYGTDHALYGVWNVVNSDSSTARFKFEADNNFSHYFDGVFNRRGRWCTNGTKLILLPENSAGTEQTYVISGSGCDRTMWLDGATWVLDKDDCFGSYKSRQDETPPLLGLIGQVSRR